MAENNSDKNSDQNTEYDPKLEAKVDALMNPKDLPKSDDKLAEQVSPVDLAATSSSAPLLPGEKLPNFDEKADSSTKIEIKDSNEKKPVLEGLVNNVPKKISEPPAAPLSDDLADDKTSKAVDDIVTSDSDRILAIEDAKAELLAEGSAEIDQGNAISRFFAAIFRVIGSKKFRIIFFFLLFAVLAAAFIYPDSRYFLLNKAGVRASTSLRVVDQQTSQPLKDAEVSIGDSIGKTDNDGNISLDKIKLGEQNVVVKKPAFADYSNPVTFGWGSNPLDDVGLIATGTKNTPSR